MLKPAVRICDICRLPVFREGSTEFFSIKGQNKRGGIHTYDLCSKCMEMLSEKVGEEVRRPKNG